MIQTLGGLNLLKDWEGLSLTVYLDVAGIATCGFGHVTELPVGATITEAQAALWLVADLAPTLALVASVAGPDTSDRQFGAMVSLTFNIGRNGFLSSTVLREHRAGNYRAASEAFLLWQFATIDGELTVVPGLADRRAAEALLYSTPDSTT